MGEAGSVPKVTVVVPARNEEGHIGECVDSILKQSYTDFELIVIDGDSEDRTRGILEEIAEGDPRVRIIDNPDRVIPVGLNRAVREARGEYLVRVDAHCTIEPDYIEYIMEHLETGRWGGVGGRKDGVGVTAAGRAVAAVMHSKFGVGNSVYHHGTEIQEVDHIPFGAYPLEVIRELGGWDTELTVNQDFEFDYRVRESGRPILFDPRIRINWVNRQTIKDFYRQYFRYGIGKVPVMIDYPKSVRPRHLAAPALVVNLAVAAALVPFRPVLSLLLVTPYAMALMAASVVTSRQVAGLRAKLLVPAAFAAMHLGWGLGFFRGLPAAIAERSQRLRHADEKSAVGQNAR